MNPFVIIENFFLKQRPRQRPFFWQCCKLHCIAMNTLYYYSLQVNSKLVETYNQNCECICVRGRKRLCFKPLCIGDGTNKSFEYISAFTQTRIYLSFTLMGRKLRVYVYLCWMGNCVQVSLCVCAFPLKHYVDGLVKPCNGIIASFRFVSQVSMGTLPNERELLR